MKSLVSYICEGSKFQPRSEEELKELVDKSLSEDLRNVLNKYYSEKEPTFKECCNLDPKIKIIISLRDNESYANRGIATVYVTFNDVSRYVDLNDIILSHTNKGSISVKHSELANLFHNKRSSWTRIGATNAGATVRMCNKSQNGRLVYTFHFYANPDSMVPLLEIIRDKYDQIWLPDVAPKVAPPTGEITLDELVGYMRNQAKVCAQDDFVPSKSNITKLMNFINKNFEGATFKLADKINGYNTYADKTYELNAFVKKTNYEGYDGIIAVVKSDDKYYIKDELDLENPTVFEIIEK